MNRTNKLLATVTASLLLGADAVPNASSTAFAQAAQQNDDAWKRDPDVAKAADQIYSWLEGLLKKDAKTKADISKHFPNLKPQVIDNALMRLMNFEGRIIQTGAGTASDPYRYYEIEEHDGSVSG